MSTQPGLLERLGRTNPTPSQLAFTELNPGYARQYRFLMGDLRRIDAFFAERGYSSSAPSVGIPSKDTASRLEESLLSGFAIQATAAAGFLFPELHFGMALAYGNQPEITQSDKRFFIDIDLFSNPQVHSSRGGDHYAYSLRVRPFQDPKQISPAAQGAERWDHYYTLPLGPRTSDPLGKLLSTLEPLM